MSRQHLNAPIIVLKFGGSVLRDEQDLSTAVHEIYRWIRQGHRVVAVVSALEGTTDALITKARTYADSSDTLHQGAYATLLATGEQTSAALLGLAIDRAGIPVEVLDAASVNLRTSGTTIDAFPASIDARGILSTLDRVPVVVLPGFIGRDAEGRTTLLGRGGSDLTALFVAERLINARAGSDPLHCGVRCRLVKDVDGLYEFDPADHRQSTRPGRYETVHWDGALALDGGIVQHKAVRYATERGLAFEVGAVLADRVTTVGDVPTALVTEDAQPSANRARIALLGCGTVGLGVYRRLIGLPEHFEIVRVCVRDVDKAAASGVARSLLTTDALEAAGCDCDLVIETIGGTNTARDAIERALRAGRNVVTANKAIIAAHGDELRELAATTGAALRFCAAVGGATPAIEAVARTAERDDIVEIVGVINGTTNFVLGRVESGESFGEAVRRAQAAGFAEADPSRDLDGRDAGDKLCVLAREAWGVTLDPACVEREALSAASIERARAAQGPGHLLRHVARVTRAPDGSIRAAVCLCLVDAADPLGRTVLEWNTLIIRAASGADLIVSGRGAGRWPTTESVIADVLECVAASRPRDLVIS